MTQALVVVDMQNDFCHPDGSLYAEGSEEVIQNVNREIRHALSNDRPIFFTLDTHRDGDDEFDQWGEHCLLGSWGHGLHEDVLFPDDAETLLKNTYDAFHRTGFNERLESRGVDTLTICGTLANVCVQETASSANLYGYDVTVPRDAVGYISEEQKNAALDHIDFLIGNVV